MKEIFVNSSYSINGMPHSEYVIGVDDILHNLQYSYARFMFVLSAILLVYVLWNNFVRSPSPRKTLKQVAKSITDIDGQLNSLLEEDLGQEPSMRVKKISKALDSYMIVFALTLTYITASYLLSFR
jgi:hypothetical protein